MTAVVESVAATLTCREARLVLPVISHDKQFGTWNENEKAAWEHYSSCQDCHKTGLTSLVELELNCKEVLEIHAVNHKWRVSNGGSTIREQIALEHVYGWSTHEESRARFVFNNHCREKACSGYLRHVHYCQCHDDLARARTDDRYCDHLPVMLKIFLEQGWQLDSLFALQLDRSDEKHAAYVSGLQQMVKTLLEKSNQSTGP